MTMQKRHLARKTTALLSAIATSSLLGLPALAGSPAGMSDTGASQAQAPSSFNQSQCVQSTQANRPSTTATPDASAPAAAQLPNQSDPRAGTSSSNQTVSPADQASGTRVDDQRTRASITKPSDAADMTRQTANDGQYQTASYRQNRSYANVLAQGGATSGGFASQQVSAANNPDAYRTASSRISSNEERPNSYSSTGANGNMGSAMSSNNSMGSTMSNQSYTQPYSQSSRVASSTTIARCPDGMTMPRSTMPSVRQTPGQSNLDTQPSSPQQMSPQQPTSNETRQSPADDNSGRAR